MPWIFKRPIPSEVYRHLFAADAETMAQLRLYCDGLIMGKVTQTESSSDEFGRVYTTHLLVDVKVAPAYGSNGREFTLQEDGAGTTVGESKLNAEERAARKLRVEMLRVPFN